MTQLIVGLILGSIIGFAAALVLNHKEPSKFDKLTADADKAADKVRDKL